MRLYTSLLSFVIRRSAAEGILRRSVIDQQKPVTSVKEIVIRPSSKHRDQHPAVQQTCDEPATSFSALRVRNDVIQALDNLGISQPTIIQMLSIPKILRRKHSLCAAETGSGKTLAYLIPLVSQLREEEEIHGVMARVKRPRAVILLPSRDLTAQVLSVLKSLCHVAKLRAVSISRMKKLKLIKETLKEPVDVVVATPGSLLKFTKQERIMLSDVSHIVIDEADTLLDQSFADEVTEVVRQVKFKTSASNDGAQLTVIAATISSGMLKTVEKIVPSIKCISTKNVHRILPHVEQRFVRVDANTKGDNLLSILKRNPTLPTMVFCNTVPSCDWTTHYLESRGINVIKLHGGLESSARKMVLKRFLEGEANVLICTDIASRGIDSTKVAQVVLFDFPNTIVDYLHRSGRTGRMGAGSNCRVYCFMSRRRDIKMAWTLKDAADKRETIMNKKASKKLQAIAEKYKMY